MSKSVDLREIKEYAQALEEPEFGALKALLSSQPDNMDLQEYLDKAQHWLWMLDYAEKLTRGRY